MRKVKICFLIPSVSSGGIEMYVLRFLNYLEKVSNITIIIRSKEKGELYDDYVATGVKLVFLPLGYINPQKLWQHYLFYKQEKFDVICDFNANFSGWVVWLAKKAGILKRIAFYRQGRNHFRPTLPNIIVNRLMNHLVYRNSTDIFSNSKAAIAFFFPYRKDFDERFQVLYNGVNPKEYDIKETKESIRENLGLPKDKYVIGHIGRLDAAKNHTFILKTFKKLNDELSDVHLVLCGRNTNQLQSQIEGLGIASHTTLLGYRRDVPRVLKSFDMFFFPSITEGQPNALIEAMLAGLPIIASNIASIKECVPNLSWHWLSDPYDVEKFVKLIKEVKIGKYDGTEILQDYASKLFNIEANFRQFEKVLIND
ncbi:glycosyltransferase [Cyclobacterium sp. SYSU L10401]|uniref:glycosyltransferase n=1 Tax=Cyclobacterium sp. SYSU L10401 TaxID=2678657 RepID=UPI0013D6E682|nr:glycosyltransferase [Cyclobacterium sp. SYSU L10401]